jgi:hypothetical protein
MNTGTRLGLAVTAGYVLGRFHKMKWAIAAAALIGRGQLPGGSGGLLQQGAKLLTSNPEFARLTDEMRDRLVDAGKAAAVAAVSSKIDALSDGLRDRTDAMHATSAGGKGGAPAGDDEDAEDERQRHDGDRDYDEDRAAQSRPKRRPDEQDASRVPPPRRGTSRSEKPRSEADRGHPARQSRSGDDAAAHSRARHPSRRSDDDGARSGSSSGARQRQDGGRTGARSSASRQRG